MRVLIALAALMVSGSYADSNDLNPAVACKLMVDGTKIRDIENCEYFYKCQGGVATHLSCASGLQYNKDSQKCVNPSQSTCGLLPDDISQICKGKAKGYWVADPYSCDGFYYCSGSGNGGQAGTCPPQTQFNENIQQCEHKKDSTCDKGTSDPDSDDAICAIVPNGLYFGNGNACNKWAVCNKGVYSTGPCGSQTQFNTLNGDCDYYSKCTQSGSTLNPIDPTKPVVPKPTDGPCTTPGAYKSDGTCVGFYWCSNDKFWRRGVCNDYKAFNGQKCVERSQVLCPTNPCANTKGSRYTWVNDPSACNKYFTCIDNIEKYEGECSVGSIFDVDKQRCVATKPEGYQACESSGIAPPLGEGGESDEKPVVPGDGGSDEKPVVPGDGGSDEKPVVPGDGGSDETPVVPGDGGSDETPVVPGDGGSDETLVVPGDEDSDETPVDENDD